MTDLEATAIEITTRHKVDATLVLTLRRINDDDVEVLIGCNASNGMLTLLPTAIREAGEIYYKLCNDLGLEPVV